MNAYWLAFVAGLGAGALVSAFGLARGRTFPNPARRGRRASPAATDHSRWASRGSPARPMLAVRGLRKAFGGLVAVDGVDLTVRRGSIHAVIGPNDAGKTTLFNLVTGLLRPDSGRVLLDGEDVTGLPPWQLARRGLGRSFQQTALFWTLTAHGNLELAAAAAADATWKLYGALPAHYGTRAGGLLDAVGLAGAATRSAESLSHGDRRSLELAATLAVGARLLLLDEPTAGLSPAETREAVALIKRLVDEEGVTLLVVEHDMEVVAEVADRVTVMHRGRVIAEGTHAEVAADPAARRAYLGDPLAEV